MGRNNTMAIVNKKALRTDVKNRPAKKYKKGQPVITRLNFEFSGQASQYISLSRALGLVNRKHYRQGCYYYVSSIELFDDSGSPIDIHVLPDNWVTRSSYRRAKRIYDSMVTQAMEGFSPSIMPKYHDFAVFMDKLHVQRYHQLVPVFDANPYLYGENTDKEVMGNGEAKLNQYTTVTTFDYDAGNPVDEFKLHMVGGDEGANGDWTSVGVINSYAKSRATVDSESPESATIGQGDVLGNLLDFSSMEATNAIIENLEDEQDQPIYEIDVYPGQEDDNLQNVGRLSSNPNIGSVDIKGGFCAPLGLIKIDPKTGMGSENAYRISITVASGTYHGVYAEDML